MTHLNHTSRVISVFTAFSSCIYNRVEIFNCNNNVILVTIPCDIADLVIALFNYCFITTFVPIEE